MGVTIAWLDAQHLGAAGLALKSLAKLVSHALPPLLLQLHGLGTAGDGSLAALGDDHLRAALSTLIALARLIGHFPSASITFQPQSSASWVVFQAM